MTRTTSSLKNTKVRPLVVFLFPQCRYCTFRPFKFQWSLSFFYFYTVYLVAVLVQRNQIAVLKVLTNEKKGGLEVVAFDRSPFKLFRLRFSDKSVQAPSSERPKTTQRTLFLSFEINNCLQITA
jgi:hypothetical protein